ncbi:MAG: TolC family protein [Candidatus Aminicenantes bacterium]|nr:TolC family protein [Acidobacteriota bacterium]MBU4405772.1 TolC family protein [Acidobacteriota bacterium]MCG2810237.1 TolC family protein [Candidatus Aminicenantes bacterium]
MGKATIVKMALVIFLLLNAHAASNGYLFSQTDTICETSSLDDLLTVAALNNPGLQAAFYRWQAVLEGTNQARALPDPLFTFAYFIQEVETRVGPQQSKIGIMQMFPWFDKLKLKGKAALAAAKSARQIYEQTRFNLFYNVKNYFYEYYYIFKNIKILEENISLLETLSAAIKAKYRSGVAAYADLIKIQLEKNFLADQLRSARERLIPMQSKLNSILNRDAKARLPLPNQIPFSQKTINEAQLLAWLRENSPELKSLEYLASKAEIDIKLAKRNYFPDFSLGVDYIITGEATMAGVADSGKDPIAAMIQISLPVWFSKNKAGVSMARANLKAAENQKRERENNLLAELEMVFFNYNDAAQKTILYRDTLLVQARQVVKVVEAAYKSGKADILNFIDSQRMLLDLELKYERSLASQAQKLAELEMLVGRDLR